MKRFDELEKEGWPVDEHTYIMIGVVDGELKEACLSCAHEYLRPKEGNV